MRVLEYLFLTIASIELPCDAAEPWQLGSQDGATPMMQGIIDLHHDIFFFLILIFVFVSWILVRVLWHFHYKKERLFILILSLLYSIYFFFLCFSGVMNVSTLLPGFWSAYCDNRDAFSPPPTPVQVPAEPVTPPPPQPVPEPVIIPQLAQPLISDEVRRQILYHRYLFLNIGGPDDLRLMVSIIDNMLLIERYIEAALVHDGWRREAILSESREIRGILHAPQGALLRERTYRSYMTQITERGTRGSIPYRRIITAIENGGIFVGERRRPL